MSLDVFTKLSSITHRTASLAWGWNTSRKQVPPSHFIGLEPSWYAGAGSLGIFLLMIFRGCPSWVKQGFDAGYSILPDQSVSSFPERLNNPCIHKCSIHRPSGVPASSHERPQMDCKFIPVGNIVPLLPGPPDFPCGIWYYGHDEVNLCGLIHFIICHLYSSHCAIWCLRGGFGKRHA